MERPSSQLENVRPSGLKPPSRLPAMMSNASRTLLETSQSELNARSAGAGGMMGPPVIPSKHRIPGCKDSSSDVTAASPARSSRRDASHTDPFRNAVPESAPKQRKTLAERAAEPLNPPRSHIPSKTSAIDRRGLTNGYRNPSTASTASSNSSMRPPSRQNGLRYARVPSAHDTTQAAIGAEDDEEEADAGIMGKRKGTPIISFNHLRKTRTHGDLRQQHHLHSADMSTRSQHSGTYIRSVSDSSSEHSSRQSSMSLLSQQEPTSHLPPTRNVSLTNAFASLSLTPKQPTRHPSSQRHRPSLEGIKEEQRSPSKIPKYSCTPSLRHTQSSQALNTPSPLKHKSSLNGLYTPRSSVVRRKDELPIFLTKEKLTSVPPVWDTKGRLEDMEQNFIKMQTEMASAADTKRAMEETLAVYKSRVQELTQVNQELIASNRNLSADFERARNDLHTTTTDLRQARRDHERDMQDFERKHERELADVGSRLEKEVQVLESERERDVERFKKEMEAEKLKWQRQKDDETADLTTAHWEEMEEVRSQSEREKAELRKQIDELRSAGESRASESASEVQEMRDRIAALQNQLDASSATMTSLRARIAAEESRNTALEQEKTALVSKTHFLEGNQEAQSQEFTTLSQRLQDAIAAKDSTLNTLRKEEMLRRKLNATILELRGNIRVFVRIRPLLTGEDDPARVEYPDLDALDGGKEMVVHAPTTLSATGKERNEKHNYAFDRVFGPNTSNKQVFEDCRDLIQSVVDGYNVSILSYGQTGSGKTFGMSGPDGIIPSSISLLLEEMRRLRVKGWEYAVQASFVEVYNETLNDLLGDAKSWDEGEDNLNGSVRGKRKERHEVHHDAVTGKTTVTNLSSVALWPPPQAGDEGSWPPAAPAPTSASAGEGASPEANYTQQAVAALLETAAKNRRVAATKSNERSSRSHSIFILTLKGHCEATGENSEGILNLVDLAGSERLKASGAEGNRAKETAAINKSLSSLGDVIAALASKKEESHIPYRNSKLTYLLQSSLGGTTSGKSSRTLMLLHLSPLAQHWQESRGSLVFGSKVNGTVVAKKR